MISNGKWIMAITLVSVAIAAALWRTGAKPASTDQGSLAAADNRVALAGDQARDAGRRIVGHPDRSARRRAAP